MATKGPILDHGYSWVILFAGALVKFLASAQGLGSLGPMFVEFLDNYDVTKTEVSWIGSIQLATTGGGGLIVGPLARRFGPRKVVMVGTAVSVCGLILSFFTTSFSQLYITYAFMTGIGGMCQTLCAIVVVSFYFEKKRSLAMGMVFFGASAANMVVPVVVVWLVKIFGLRGTFLLMAGLQMQALWLGALMRPQTADARAAKNDPVEHTSRKEDCGQNGLELQNVSERKPQGFSESLVGLHENSDNVEKGGLMPVNYLKEQHTTSLKELSMNTDTAEAKENAEPRSPENDNGQPEIYEKEGTDITESGQLATDGKTDVTEKPANKSSLATVLGLSLLKDRAYLMILLALFLELLGHVIPFAFLPMRAVSNGASATQAALLLSVLSLAGLFARPLMGLVGDKVGHRKSQLMALSLCVAGGLSVLSAFVPSYPGLVVYALTFGISASFYIVICNPACIDLFGLDMISIITGQSFVCYGLACFIVLPLSGMLIEYTNNAAIPFLLGGCLEILGGCCWVLANSIKRRKRVEEANENVDPVDSLSES